MKMHSTFTSIGAALLFTLLTTAARADDTEIFFNQTNSTVGANVLLILDTSGSMDDEVTSGPDYDATQTYPTSGSCDSNYVYYASSGTPACGTSNRILKTQFKCASAASQLGNGAGASGQFGDTFIRWGAVTSGRGSSRTTVMQWTNNLGVSSGTSVECYSDAGIDGDGSSTTNLWPTKNSDPTATTGIWSTVGNSWWSVFGNTGTNTTFYSANYINYTNDAALNITQTKIKIMQSAIQTLLGSVSGVNVGLMRYDYNGNGGMVMNAVGPVATNGPLISANVNSWAAAGNTPLVKTLYEAYLYYSGGNVNYGNGSHSTTCLSTTTNSNGAVHCTSAIAFAQNSVAASRVGGRAAGTAYDSPADLACQRNYVIFLTDGQSNNTDTTINRTINGLPNFATLGGACDASVQPGANGGQCLGALAQYMYQSDLRSDVGQKQNVTSYFIGFGDTFKTDPNATAYYNYLSDAATRGGGKAFTATSLSELTAVFAQIFSEVQNVNTSFSAPAVAVNAFNRTQTLDDLYVSVFKPSGTYHWPGNVKKYKVTNGIVTDSNGNPAVDPSTGFSAATSQSYWSAAVDGPDVNKGGVASNLPDPTTRTLYTYLGANRPASATAVVGIASATDTDFAIGGATDPSRVDLINWAKGQDVQDDNNNGSTTDERYEMGDPIHTQPIVVIYGTGAHDTVLYVPTNDGYLHSIDAYTSTDGHSGGVENWAFIPHELLSKLKLQYADDPSTLKHYALDGQVTVIKYDVNGDGVIDSAAGDRVVIYFSTGRNADVQAYYALDVTDKMNPKFLWMIDGSILPDLGQTWSTPTVARVNISGGGVTQNSQKLVLIFGGGYDPVEDGYTYVPADSVGTHIYMVDALYGTLLWSVGGSSSSSTLKLARMDHSIPSPVTVMDLNGDGYADRMYVGDMGGQLWRFDIANGQSQSNLVVGGVIASLGSHEETTHLPANNRRIYAAPDAAAVIKNGISPFISLSFGTGYRGHPLDTTTIDRLYSIRDYNTFNALTQTQYNNLMLAANLVVDSSLTDITTSTLAAAGVPANSPGWKIVLNNYGGHGAGEKVLVPARTFGNAVFFTTYTPSIAVTTDPCSGVGSGINRSYIVSVFDGKAVIDRNADGSLTQGSDVTNDDRVQDLPQGGIASETTILFPAGTTQPNCFSNLTALTCPNVKRRLKSYWLEGTAN